MIVVTDQPDGRNINDRLRGDRPVAGRRGRGRRTAAHVGIALDGDADRLIAVDQRGDVVDGDHIIAICAADLRDRGLLRDDTVVVTVMTNLGFRLAMEAAGIHVVETAVGDRYVLEALAAGGYSLGGEQSRPRDLRRPCHDRRRHAHRRWCCSTSCSVPGGRCPSWPATAMTQLPQVLVNVPVSERRPDIAERARRRDRRRRGASSATRAASSFARAAPSRWSG